MDDPEKGYPVTPCMGVYKENMKYYEGLDKLKIIVVVRGNLQDKEKIGDTWDTTVSMRTTKPILVDASKH